MLAKLDAAGRSAAGFELQHFVDPVDMEPCTPVRQAHPPRAAAPSEERRSAAGGSSKGEEASGSSSRGNGVAAVKGQAQQRGRKEVAKALQF